MSRPTGFTGEYDTVNHPKHYKEHPSGVECIEITEHMNFCLGNAVKYIWRADEKNGTEDLKKAAWYINREIQRREAATKEPERQIQPHNHTDSCSHTFGGFISGRDTDDPIRYLSGVRSDNNGSNQRCSS